MGTKWKTNGVTQTSSSSSLLCDELRADHLFCKVSSFFGAVEPEQMTAKSGSALYSLTLLEQKTRI